MARTPRRSGRPRLEALEDRLVPAPVILDPALDVRAHATGFTQPTGMVFLGANELLVNEKTTGRVQHVRNGAIVGTALDLNVNFGSERGLLGIAISQHFETDRHVFLFWTESTTGGDTNVLANTTQLGNRVDRYVWNGSTLTFDRAIIQLRALQPAFAQEPTPAAGRGNHDGGVLRIGTDDKLYIIVGDVGRRGLMQNLTRGFGPNGDDDQFGGPEMDNAHLTGVIIRLNLDGSIPADNPFVDDVLAAAFTDLRGTNEVPPNTSPATGFVTALVFPARDAVRVTFNFTGLTADTLPGGAHIHIGSPTENGPIILPFDAFPAGLRSGQFEVTFTAETFRPNPARGINTFEDAIQAILDGRTYFNVHTNLAQGGFPGGEIRGQLIVNQEATANIHRTYAYGIRNSFGFAIDPFTGYIWEAENSDDSYEEVNRIAPGHNGGWVQAMGPISRVADFRLIETTPPPGSGAGVGLQQNRWPPTLIANTEAEARERIFNIPGSQITDPQFSIRFAMANAGTGFQLSNNLGAEYFGDLFVGSALPAPIAFDGGFLFRFNLSADRENLVFTHPGLQDRVFDNTAKNSSASPTDSIQEIRFGTGFGVTTEIVTGPNGNLFVLSLSDGAIYEIFRRSTPGGSGDVPAPPPDEGGELAAASFTGGDQPAPAPTLADETVPADTPPAIDFALPAGTTAAAVVGIAASTDEAADGQLPGGAFSPLVTGNLDAYFAHLGAATELPEEKADPAADPFLPPDDLARL